jgi:hypothetical protein
MHWRKTRHWAVLLVFLLVFQQTLAFAGGRQKGKVRIHSVSQRHVKLRAGAPTVRIKVSGRNLDTISSVVVLLNNMPTNFVKASLGPPHKNRRNLRLRAAKNAPTKCCYTIQVRSGGYQTIIPTNLLRIETVSTATASPLLPKNTKKPQEKTTASAPVVKKPTSPIQKPTNRNFVHAVTSSKSQAFANAKSTGKAISESSPSGRSNREIKKQVSPLKGFVNNSTGEGKQGPAEVIIVFDGQKLGSLIVHKLQDRFQKLSSAEKEEFRKEFEEIRIAGDTNAKIARFNAFVGKYLNQGDFSRNDVESALKGVNIGGIFHPVGSLGGISQITRQYGIGESALTPVQSGDNLVRSVYNLITNRPSRTDMAGRRRLGRRHGTSHGGSKGNKIPEVTICIDCGKDTPIPPTPSPDNPVTIIHFVDKNGNLLFTKAVSNKSIVKVEHNNMTVRRGGSDSGDSSSGKKDEELKITIEMGEIEILPESEAKKGHTSGGSDKGSSDSSGGSTGGSDEGSTGGSSGGSSEGSSGGSDEGSSGESEGSSSGSDQGTSDESGSSGEGSSKEKNEKEKKDESGMPNPMDYSPERGTGPQTEEECARRCAPQDYTWMQNTCYCGGEPSQGIKQPDGDPVRPAHLPVPSKDETKAFLKGKTQTQIHTEGPEGGELPGGLGDIGHDTAPSRAPAPPVNPPAGDEGKPPVDALGGGNPASNPGVGPCQNCD